MRLTELSPFAGRTCLWFMVFNATFNNIAATSPPKKNWKKYDFVKCDPP
jgi:hypothetical protein